MRRLILLLCFLLTTVMAFSISGRVFMRFGSYPDPVDPTQTTNVIGPMFSFWGVENNVDLWQGKDGTGFEVNFDSFSFLYKTREALTIANWINSSNYGYSQKWGPLNAKATSPGYFRLENIKIGPAYFAIGLAPWVLVAEKSSYDTNSAGTTNNNYAGNIGYVKGYADFKVDIPFNENITLKMYDWDLMWLEFFTGNSTLKGSIGGGAYYTNTYNGGGFKIYVPPHLVLNLDQFQLDFSPRAIFDNSISNYLDSANFVTNNYGEIYYRFGAFMRITYNFDRVFGVYGMFGYFNESDTIVLKTNGGGEVNKKYNANIIPIYAGLKLTITPNIVFTLGYGVNLMLNDTYQSTLGGVTTTIETGPELRNGYLRNWMTNISGGFMQVPSERQTYGDSLMDVSFLKFGATVKIINNWEMGMAAAVSLNDGWNREYLNSASYNYTYVNPNGNSGNEQMYNWLSFLNWMDYDNNMYLKFETDTFIAKLTFDMWARPDSKNATIMNLFGFVDFTYKF